MLLHFTLLVVGIALITQFAYSFSTIKSIGVKQVKFILWFNTFLSLAAIILSVGFLLNYFDSLLHDLIPTIVQIFLVLEITFLMIFFIFLTIKLAGLETDKSWISRFFRPRGRLAIAAQGFAITTLILWVGWLVSLLLYVYEFKTISFFIFTLVTTWTLTFFVISLINQTVRKASFFFKFILLILLTTFTGISAGSWLTAPAQTANFLAMFSMPNLRSIQFDQDNAVFEITNSEFEFMENIGDEVIFPADNKTISQELDTTFPFSGKNWNSIQINQKGFIAFSENQIDLSHLSLPGNPNPIIATLYIQDFNPSEESKVFFNSIDDRAIITWFLASEESENNTYINTQLVLNPEGSFTITFNDIRVNRFYDPYIPQEMQQVSGFFLGENDKFPTRVKFSTQLPFTSVNWKGVYQDYYLDFRNHLHWSISMQFIAMLIVAVLMIVIYPIFIQYSLVKPIQALRNGFSQVLHGDLSNPIEPRYSDDLGQATYEFNQMARTLNDKNTGYEKRIAEVEGKLDGRSVELKQTLDKLADEIENRKTLKQNLDLYIQQNQKLQITDEFGCNNRAQIINMLEDEIKRSKRYNTPLSIAVLNPDYLRMINETYGFSTGNEVLISLVKTLLNNMRDTDIVGRISGEEFAIIMPQTGGNEAVIGANRIRNLIGTKPVETKKGLVRLSVSFGVVEIQKEGVPSVDLILHQANVALEAAKKQGRNQTVLFSSSLEKKSK
jgi:diguanylate cyclase (GGDEF)-like protein